MTTTTTTDRPTDRLTVDGPTQRPTDDDTAEDYDFDDNNNDNGHRRHYDVASGADYDDGKAFSSSV